MTLFRSILFMLALSLTAAISLHAAPPVLPYETDRAAGTSKTLDGLVLSKLKDRGIEPANLCSDEVFMRRVYLDVIGSLPEPPEIRKFLQDRSSSKRAALIESLLKREEFPDYWANKWADLLRVKSEFPINLWPNAVQAYHRWIHDAIRDNMPYDQFARELLTSSGSNFRVGPANFYRAVQGRTPASIAQAVALTFMGTRIEKWPEPKRTEMAAFFSRIKYKQTGEWKEEIVCLDPASTGTLETVYPDGTAAQIKPDQDPRQVFADWLITPSNPYFTRNIVNRTWAWLFGRGIVHETDDIHPGNPPSNPELLAYLEKELVNAKYDVRQLFRVILNSRTYQQSSIPQSKDPKAEALFAYYPVRRLDAEVLIDALCWLGGPGEGYSSPIPEPFTFIPDGQRTIALADGSISSTFLELFGRPTRDTGLESERNNQPNESQRMHLLNSTHIQRKIERSERLRKLMQASKRNPNELVRLIYMTVLSRPPAPDELNTAQTYFNTRGLNLKQAEEDLVWALVNTKEFLYRH